MRKPGLLKKKCSAYVQDGYVLIMMKEAGQRNCLGFISHNKDSELAIHYTDNSLNDGLDKNDKNPLMLQNNYSG